MFFVERFIYCVLIWESPLSEVPLLCMSALSCVMSCAHIQMIYVCISGHCFRVEVTFKSSV